MATASHVALRLRLRDIPLLLGAREYAEREIFPGGLGRNRDFVLPHVRFADSIDAASRAILFDPETSGGLLMALPPDQAQALVAQAGLDGLTAFVIGEVAAGAGIEVE